MVANKLGLAVPATSVVASTSLGCASAVHRAFDRVFEWLQKHTAGAGAGDAATSAGSAPSNASASGLAQDEGRGASFAPRPSREYFRESTSSRRRELPQRQCHLDRNKKVDW